MAKLETLQAGAGIELPKGPITVEDRVSQGRFKGARARRLPPEGVALAEVLRAGPLADSLWTPVGSLDQSIRQW